jgi:hypothetical protein
MDAGHQEPICRNGLNCVTESMRTRRGVIGSALLAAALVFGGAGLARAGGDITFRLILRGDVIEGDSFTLAVNELADPPTIISPGIRC